MKLIFKSYGSLIPDAKLGEKLTYILPVSRGNKVFLPDADKDTMPVSSGIRDKLGLCKFNLTKPVSVGMFVLDNASNVKEFKNRSFEILLFSYKLLRLE